MRKFLRVIFTIEGWHGLLTSQLVAPWLWPAVGAVLIGASYYLSIVPIPYLLAAMAVGFAAIAQGTLRISEWRQKNSIESKLAFSGPLYFADIDANEETSPIVINMQLGAKFDSLADFPIEFRIDEFYSEFDSHVPSDKARVGDTHEIPAHGSGFHRDNRITVNQSIRDSAVTGEIKYKISYWRKGHRRIATLERRHLITVGAKDKASILCTHHDA